MKFVVLKNDFISKKEERNQGNTLQTLDTNVKDIVQNESVK